MKIALEHYEFDFPRALDAFKFDESDPAKLNYHGVTQLRAVDLLVEFKKEYLFVEIKTYSDLYSFTTARECSKCGSTTGTPKDYLKWSLVRKFRETLLYRFAEDKVDKPITYICIINRGAPFLMPLCASPEKEIPVGNMNLKRWKRPLLERVFVVDEAAWGRNFTTVYGTCKKQRS